MECVFSGGLIIIGLIIFFKSFFNKLGTDMASMVTKKDLVKLEEQVKKDFNEKIEKYKSDLSIEVGSKLEPLKAELAKANMSHNIQFGYLHEKRAEVVLEMYKNLQELHSAISVWTRPLQPLGDNAEMEEKNRRDRAYKAFVTFKDYFILNKIFFSDSFCNEIEQVIQKYSDISTEFDFPMQMNKAYPNEPIKIDIARMEKIYNELRNILPNKIRELEKTFRKLLYVKDDEV